ncbi:uncharacterized protein LOC107878240 [Capsicum annuum]|uniref:uncharacterized protein LOC107878240 n=1 Tax=Capsicum annuum TaxID=4072 RepID=UPI001FB0DCD2|nr:uncharacterized protein LOC107878240 [Capsicum annuum]
MVSIPVLVKHSGRWTYEKNFEEYVTDAILLSTSTTFVELHDVLASHLSVDLTIKRILVEYQITPNAGQIIGIHNDMSLKVFILQKKLIQDMNCLPLYVSILDKVVGSNLASSSIYVAVRGINCNNLETVINTTNEGALVVCENTEALDVFEMDSVEVIISDPHHKHVEEDQVYLRKRILKSVMKVYSIREKFQMRSKRSNKKMYTLFCKSRNCEFLMRASGKGETKMFRIREFRPQHTCPLNDKIYPKMHATSMLIAGMVKQKFKNHKRKYSTTEIKNDMKKDFGMDLTYILCWRAKERALEELRGKPSTFYGKLPSYLYVLNTTYPESHIRMKKTDDNAFLYVFIVLHAFIKGFDHCRPVVVVDASHLRGMYTEAFVTVCITDGAGHIFPLAYDVLDSENDASWTWFF